MLKGKTGLWLVKVKLKRSWGFKVEIGDLVPLPHRRRQDLCGDARAPGSEDLLHAGATHDATADKGVRSVVSKRKRSAYLSGPSALALALPSAGLPAPVVASTTARVLLHEEKRPALAESKEKNKKR
jgi:hypothetical protein